jgi:hypothetical protein
MCGATVYEISRLGTSWAKFAVIDYFYGLFLEIVTDAASLEKAVEYQVLTPSASLYVALGLSPLSVGQIGTVIAPLHPGHEGQQLLKRICPQWYNHFQQGPELRYRQRWSFFFPNAASDATERNTPASSSACDAANPDICGLQVCRALCHSSK